MDIGKLKSEKISFDVPFCKAETVYKLPLRQERKKNLWKKKSARTNWKKKNTAHRT